MDLPEPMATELDRLLATWTAAHRLTEAQSVEVHQRVVASQEPLDADWLWNVLQPVTSLLEQVTARDWRQFAFGAQDDRPVTPYLQLA
jgi:hypothetical protein